MNPKIYLIFFLFFCSNNTMSIGGVGDVVTDPGSYAYYAEQIKSATEQINILNEQLENAERALKIHQFVKDGISSVAGDLIGVYNNSIDLVEATQRLTENAEDLPSDLQNRYYKELDKSEDTIQGFERMEKFLNRNYRNPLSGDYDPLKYDLFRYSIEQGALKTILKQSAQSLSNNDERIETIDKLAKEIDSTENIKDSSDLNNRLLTELLIVVNEMNTTLNQLAQIEALGKYHDAEGAEQIYEATTVTELENSRVYTTPEWMKERLEKAKNNKLLPEKLRNGRAF